MRKKPTFILFMSLVFYGCTGFMPDTPSASETILPTDLTAMATTPEATTKPASAAPAGWLTYDNDEFGFYFHYPPTYKVLTDETNLYGWENGVALLYNGGQSYDIAVQVWESADEIAAFYGGEDERLHVYPQGAQILSVMNLTNETDNEAIIASFTLR